MISVRVQSLFLVALLTVCSSELTSIFRRNYSRVNFAKTKRNCRYRSWNRARPMDNAFSRVKNEYLRQNYKNQRDQAPDQRKSRKSEFPLSWYMQITSQKQPNRDKRYRTGPSSHNGLRLSSQLFPSGFLKQAGNPHQNHRPDERHND